MAKHANAHLPALLPACPRGGFFEKSEVASQQNHYASTSQHAIELPHQSAVKRTDLLGITKLFPERRITDNAVETLVRQR